MWALEVIVYVCIYCNILSSYKSIYELKFCEFTIYTNQVQLHSKRFQNTAQIKLQHGWTWVLVYTYEYTHTFLLLHISLLFIEFHVK